MSTETPANTSDPSVQNQGSRVKVEIEVQPPSSVGINRRLIPPVVARTNNPQLIEDYLAGNKDVFAVAMLTSSNGDDQTAILNGNYSTQGQPITLHGSNGGSHGGGSSSRQSAHKWIYFIFQGLSIPIPGTYTFTICVNALSYTEGFSMTVGGKTTNEFTVVNQAVAPARPSKQLVLSLIYTHLE